MAILDPVDLSVLAEALRDGVLLDVRSVDAPSLERVAVTGIMVRCDHEEIEFSREGESIMVPADGIMRVLPTAFEEGDELTMLGKSELRFVTKTRNALVAALAVVAPRFKLTPEYVDTVIEKGKPIDPMRLRYWVMLVVDRIYSEKRPDWTTHQRRHRICNHFDYKSIQPFQSATYMVTGEGTDKEAHRLSLELMVAEALEMMK